MRDSATGKRDVPLPVEELRPTMEFSMAMPLADRLQALARFFFEAAAHQLANFVGHVGGQQRPIGFTANHGGESVGNGFAFESHFAGEHFVEHGAEGPDVGTTVNHFAAGLFRGHVAAVPMCPALVAAAVRVGELVMSELAVSSDRAFARPKSRTFTVPSGVIFIFAGFRSRCTMPRSCAYSRASVICLATGRTSSTGIGPSASAFRQGGTFD